MTETHTLETARRHVALAAEYKGLTGSQTESLLLRFDTAARRTDDGGVTYLDLQGQPLIDEANGYRAADTAGFLRYVAKVSPSLLEPSTETAPTAAPVTSSPSSAADAMQQVRSGTMSAADATARLFALQAAPAPAKAAAATDARAPAPTISELMAAVRQGRPGAETALEAAMKKALR